MGSFSFLTPLHYYYLALALTLCTLFCVARLMRSRVGRALAHIRFPNMSARDNVPAGSR